MGAAAALALAAVSLLCHTAKLSGQQCKHTSDVPLTFLSPEQRLGDNSGCWTGVAFWLGDVPTKQCDSISGGALRM
jgi:hypothetical protein